jgi:hypothetical protein
MNQKYNSEFENELREEYNFNSLPVIRRGLGRKINNRFRVICCRNISDTIVVNKTLSFLIKISQKTIPQLQ